MSHGGELAATTSEGREWYFTNLATGRILGVSSGSESWAEDCGPFEQLDWNWRSVDVAPKGYPLKRGEMTFELVAASLPAAAAMTLEVDDHCTGVVRQPLPKQVEAPKMPDIPVGPMAKVPVDELEGIKPAREAWASLFRERKWAELERTVRNLIDTGARLENGGWKMFDFDGALTVGPRSLTTRLSSVASVISPSAPTAIQTSASTPRPPPRASRGS